MPVTQAEVRKITSQVILCALLVVASTTGCRSLQIPRIDPTGERIFLPAPNYTTLETPLAPGNSPNLSCLPTPAYQAPPTPPPCAVATAPALAGQGAVLGPPPCATPLPQQAITPTTRLTLSPTRIVAPLQSQVVLIAGVCGPNNRYLGGEQVEWFLSKDSAGHFLELEGEHIGGVGRMLHPLPRKVSADYAVGKTSVNGGRIITCGKKQDEKLWLREGQTWITLTSATEGVSRVTAFSPDGESSPARQETAEVYWVDVQYTLPAPTPTRAGDQALLSTTVTRNSNGLPLPGWIVRYEYAGGNQIGIGPQGVQYLDALTDQNGVATVGVAQQEIKPGTTEVRVTIMRPAGQAGEPDNIPVHTGMATIPWSASGLRVQTVGPAAVQLGSVANYQIIVDNPGDLPSEGVVAQAVVPQGMQLVAADPQPSQIVGDRLMWNMGQLQALSRQSLTMQLRCDTQGEFNVCSSAQSATGELSDQSCVKTGVYRPAIRVEMAGPETAEVGQLVEFRIQVINDGQLPLRQVVMTDRYDQGLRYSTPGPLQNLIGDLAPGEVRRIKVTFQVVAAGQQRNLVEVTTEGGHTASAQAMVNVAEPQQPPATNPPPGQTPGGAGPTQPTPAAQGRFGLTIRGPGQQRVGDNASYTAEVTNLSNVTLTNVRLAIAYSTSLVPGAASGGFQVDQGSQQVFWNIGQLAPGASAERTLQCKCLREDVNGGAAALATADNAPAERREAGTQIMPAPNQPSPARPAPTPAAPAPSEPVAAGSLKINIVEPSDPVQRGATVTYLINITNDRNVSDRDVGLTVRVPAGMKLESLRGPQNGPIRTNGQDYVVPPFAEVRAGETLKFTATVTMQATGMFNLTAEAHSRRSQQGVVASEQTTVVGQ